MSQSSNKGKRGERELCRELRQYGFGAIRSAQVAGVKGCDDSADIITSIDPVRFEVKRGYEGVGITSQKFDGWRRKLISETVKGEVPALAWRKNRQPWMFFLFGRGEFRRAELMIGLGAFIEGLASFFGGDISEYKVDDPQSWRTTGTFT